MRQVNNEVIKACEDTINNEEKEDTELRTQHGAKFNRPPSATVNQQYKSSLVEYKGRIEMAVATDNQVKEKFEANRQGFQLLGKTR